MKLWNRFEQYFKHKQLRFLERFLGVPPLRPEDVDKRSIQRILVVRQHDQLGDFLLSTPVFKALKRNFPHSELSVVVRSYVAPLVQHHEYVDNIIIFHSLTSDLIARFSRSRYILGSEHLLFEGTERNFFYHLTAPYRKEPRSQSERNLDIVRYLGIDESDAREHITLTTEEVEWAKEHLKSLGRNETRPLVAIHPGAGKIGNRWPVENFASVAQRLIEECDVQLYLTWGPNEADLGRKLMENISSPVLFSTHSQIRRVAAVLKQAKLLLCNDTGILHVGASVGIPVIAIFGPTDPQEWKPVGEKIIAIRAQDHLCASVQPEEVLRAAKVILTHQK